VSALSGLFECYHEQNACHERAARTLALLREGEMATIFQSGLHEFLSDFIAGNNSLASEIAASYHFND
jgi:uncharacterized alpha-E superfamily protein